MRLLAAMVVLSSCAFAGDEACERAAAAWLSLGPDAEAASLRGSASLLASTKVWGCSDETLSRLLSADVQRLEDRRVMWDDSASDGSRVEVRHAARDILERITGTSRGELITLGGLGPPGRHVTTQAEEKATVAAWRAWWKEVEKSPRSAIASGRASNTAALDAERRRLEARLLAAELVVAHAWRAAPYVEPLTLQNANIGAPEWGGFVSRDGGALFQVGVYNSGAVLKATASPTTTLIGQADYPARAVLEWKYGKALPLAALAKVGRAKIPRAMLEDLRANEPAVYEHALSSLHLEFTAFEGDTVVRLGLREVR